jgi:lipoate-protein ligase A
MHLLDLTLPTPAENLACDEALLDAGVEVLRFWESPQPFVVVGYSNKLSTEVNLAACTARGVPVLRRCSGGGTVVQGPGSFNYSLILAIERTGDACVAPTTPNPFSSVTGTNNFIMSRHRDALRALLGDGVAVHGTTDLALNGVKFSGNAQRRKRRHLLFHGTFLVGFDLELIEQLLPLPTLRPCYRQDRSHRQFLTNLPVSREAIKAALMKCWNATEPLAAVPHDAIQRLVAAHYAARDWTHKF